MKSLVFFILMSSVSSYNNTNNDTNNGTNNNTELYQNQNHQLTNNQFIAIIVGSSVVFGVTLIGVTLMLIYDCFDRDDDNLEIDLFRNKIPLYQNQSNQNQSNQNRRKQYEAIL